MLLQPKSQLYREHEQKKKQNKHTHEEDRQANFYDSHNNKK
jgi:hypothetical protein